MLSDFHVGAHELVLEQEGVEANQEEEDQAKDRHLGGRKMEKNRHRAKLMVMVTDVISCHLSPGEPAPHDVPPEPVPPEPGLMLGHVVCAVETYPFIG